MANLADVAARAGVSKSTASRVLNGKAFDWRISDQTVAAVERSAAELGYKPNYAAKALSSGRTHTVGMIGPLLQADPEGRTFFAPVMAGISEHVRHAGFTLLFTQFDWHTMGLDAATSRQVEALIAPGFVMSPNFTALDLEALGSPMVLIDDPPVPSRHPVVTYDPSAGLAAAVDHLVALGHRRFAWIGFGQRDGDGALRSTDRQHRDRIMARQLAVHGLEPVETIQLETGAQRGRDRAERIAEVMAGLANQGARLDRATAFLCYNDLVAVATMRALVARGRPVPAAASVVGIDNFWADVPDPALTTVDMRLFDLGRRVGEVAIDIAEHPEARERWRSVREAFTSSLVIRGSTGPAPTP